MVITQSSTCNKLDAIILYIIRGYIISNVLYLIASFNSRNFDTCKLSRESTPFIFSFFVWLNTTSSPWFPGGIIMPARRKGDKLIILLIFSGFYIISDHTNDLWIFLQMYIKSVPDKNYAKGIVYHIRYCINNCVNCICYSPIRPDLTEKPQIPIASMLP